MGRGEGGHRRAHLPQSQQAPPELLLDAGAGWKTLRRLGQELRGPGRISRLPERGAPRHLQPHGLLRGDRGAAFGEDGESCIEAKRGALQIGQARIRQGIRGAQPARDAELRLGLAAQSPAAERVGQEEVGLVETGGPPEDLSIAQRRPRIVAVPALLRGPMHEGEDGVGGGAAARPGGGFRNGCEQHGEES